MDAEQELLLGLVRTARLPANVGFLLHAGGVGSVVDLESLLPGICISPPDPVAFQSLVQACVTAGEAVDAAYVQGLRTFVTLAGHSHTECARRLAQSVAGHVAPAELPPVLLSSPAAVTDEETDRRNRTVAARQWTSFRRVNAMKNEVERSKQMPDTDVAKWFLEAYERGRFQHFPDLMKVLSATAIKGHTERKIGTNLVLRLDEHESVDEKALVATCLANARFCWQSIMAALTFRTLSATQGGPPGEDGYREVYNPTTGQYELQRYFAVEALTLYMDRFTQASKTEIYYSLPYIWFRTLERIGDLVGGNERHMDTVVRLVCEKSDLWESQKSDVPAGRQATRGHEDAPDDGRPPQIPGRCHTFDSFGSCPKGKMCPWRGAHQDAPSRKPPYVGYQRSHPGRGPEQGRYRSRSPERQRSPERRPRPRSPDRRPDDRVPEQRGRTSQAGSRGDGSRHRG